MIKIIRMFPALFALIFIVACQEKQSLTDELDGLPKPGEILVQFSAAPENIGTYHPGEVLRTRIEANIKPGWKLYTLKYQNENAPPPTKIKYAGQSLIPVKETYETKPIDEFLEIFNLSLQVHKERGVFYQNFDIPQNHAAGNFSIPANIEYVTCSNKVCMPPQNAEVAFNYDVSNGPTRPDFTRHDYSVEQINSKESSSYKSEGIFSFLILAVLMGLISLTTPCVFPMVPITVSYFTKKSNNSRKILYRYATLFSLGIIISYTILGLLFSLLFGADSVVNLAANPWVNVLLGMIFILFSMSLIGIINLQLPPGLINIVERYTQGGNNYLGVIVMGTVFTLTAFTCTVQFIGVLMVAAYQGDILWPLLGMLIFSTVFALPFFLFAILPGAIPKVRQISPDHLINIKIILGILELGIAVKFFSNADLVWDTSLISRDVNLLIWVCLFTISAGYILYYEFRKKQLHKLSGYKVVLIFFAFATFYFSNGLNNTSVGAFVDSVLPSPKNGFLQKKGNYVSEETFAQMSWHPSLDAALLEAKGKNRPIFIDFTGYTCINCRWMEQNVFLDKEIFVTLKDKYVRAQLYTDGGDYAQINRELQINKFGTVSLPFYAIIDKYGNPIRTESGIIGLESFLAFISK